MYNVTLAHGAADSTFQVRTKDCPELEQVSRVTYLSELSTMAGAVDTVADGEFYLNFKFSDKPQDEPPQKKPKNNMDTEEELCTICMQELDRNIFQYRCKHKFHTSCIIQYVEFSKQIG